MDFTKPCNFQSILPCILNKANCIYILNKAEEDIRMLKHVLEIKVCFFWLLPKCTTVTGYIAQKSIFQQMQEDISYGKNINFK